MANQIIQTQGSAIGQLGEGVKTGKAKGEAKGGLFTTLIASFQKHIKQAESGLQINAQKTSGKEKLAVNGLKTALSKVTAESVKGVSKSKSLLKADGVDKATKGEYIKGKSLLTKQLLQAADAQVLAGKAGEKQNVLSAEKLVDDTQKLQKHTAIGLGVFQQESRQPVVNKLGEGNVKEALFAGLEGKKSKNAEIAGKSPGLVMDVQDLAGKKDASVGQEARNQNKTEKIVAETLVVEGKTAEVSSVKGGSQGRFTLKDINTLKDGVDVSKLIKRDELASVKNQSKSDAVDIAKSQVKSEEASAKSVSLISAASTTDHQLISQDDINKRQMSESSLVQAKQVKNSQLQEGLNTEENVSKVKASLKAVAAKLSGVVGVQPQTSVSAASNVQAEIVMASSSGQDANMAGDQRGTGRSAAELLMADGSIRDVRTSRSDFAMQMAYRSAASFKPSEAMLEISKAAKDGSMKLELMLEPATLGKIQVTIQSDAMKHIQVHLVVDQQTSRQVLEQQLPQLRQALADQGLNLSGFTMDMNSQQQGGEQASRGFSGSGFMSGGSNELEHTHLQTSAHMGVNMADDGSLSILA